MRDVRRWARRAACVIAAAFLFVEATPMLAQELPDDADILPPVPSDEAAVQRVSAFTGLTVIGDEAFWRVDLRPSFAVGRLGVGLKGVLLVGSSADGEGTELLTEDGEEWDAGAVLRSVRYVRWATPRAPLYAMYGELFDARIGHGLLMEGYANYDRRGLRLNVNRGLWGVETLLNDVRDPALFGGRAYVRPLAVLDAGGVLRRLTVGATYLTDVNPYPDSGAEGVPGVADEDALLAYAADISYPLVATESVLLEVYDEAARLSFPDERPDRPAETRSGNATGVGFELSPVRAKLEYRTFEAGFVPTLFGSNYEYVARTPGLGARLDPADDSTSGVYGSASLRIGEQAWIGAIFEDYDGSGPASDPRLSARFVETDLLEDVDVQAYYSKRGIGGTDAEGEPQSFLQDLVDLDEKSLLVVSVGYRVSGPLQVRVVREYRFRRRPDGPGFEPIRKTTVQLGLALAF
jgi:hypothetical protein